jgi:hypothetical protein
MDLYGITMAFLVQLPALGIGFIAGMLFMRGNYLRVIRWLKVVIARQQRQMNSMISPWN